MKTKIHYWLGLLLCLISTPLYAQQVSEEWAKHYNSTGGQNGIAADIAVDAAGNVYVTGTSSFLVSGSDSDRAQITTVKYSPAGVLQWSKSYDAEPYTVASAIATDNAGGVYVTGYTRVSDTNHDYITIRYAATDGTQGWVRHYDGPAGGIDRAIDIAADNMGGVYVTGNSDGGSTGNDIATIRYNATTGDVGWAKRINSGSNNRDEVAALVLDNEGGLYLTGTSIQETAFQFDFITARYNAATGSRSWYRTFRGEPGSFAFAIDLAVDNAGGLYVTGRYDRAGTNADIATIRYQASSGSRRWVKFYNGETNGFDQPRAITVDNEGGVYVTGEQNDWDTGDRDIVTIRYEGSNGSSTWTKVFEGGYSFDIAVDNTGGVYVTGSRYNPLLEASEYLTIRYRTADGHQSWAEFFDLGFDSSNSAIAVAADNNGGVYVTGTGSDRWGGRSFATIRYETASGAESWVRLFRTVGNMNDTAVAVATDEAGNSYVTGWGPRGGFVTIKYSPAGDSLWVVKFVEEFPADPRAIAVDNSGGVYITGTSRRGLVGPADYITNDIITIRYDATTGERSWIAYYDGGKVYDDTPSAIAVNNDGSVYVTGNSMFGDDGSDSPREYITIRYDAATGDQKWTARFKEETYNGIRYTINSATALTVDYAGGVYVTGRSRTYAGSNTSDYLTIHYDATTGTEKWRKRYNSGIEYDEGAKAITVDNSGGVYVTGTTSTLRYETATSELTWDAPNPGTRITVDNQGGVYVMDQGNTSRLEAATGSQTWAVPFPGRAAAIAADGAGGVYVAGTSYTDETFANSTFYTVKYNALSGALIWDIQTAGPNDVAVDMALDNENNVIVTGHTQSPETGRDFLTVKYNQTSCATLAEASIAGSLNVPVGTNRSVYSLPVTNATTYTWTITDIEGRMLSSFNGQGSNSITVNWPSNPGFYKLSVTYGAGENCPSYTAIAYVHVFDPGAGFVTGGGWFLSPANPDYEFMQTSTKAHFGLAAKYKKGDENLVQGETYLQLENGSFYFRGTTQQARTLVIVGDHAFYRGSGTVSYRNDAGQRVTDPRQFTFLVAATDGGQGKGKEPDKLRIIVWEMNEDGSRGAVVYDNQANCSGSLDENALACQEINGGNIKIHRPELQGKKDQQLLSSESPTILHDLSAYPTAFQDRTTIAFSSAQETAYTLDLYDLKGALVKRIAAGMAEEGKLNQYELQAAGLSKGLYFARLTTDQGVQTVKIILQR